MGVKSVAVPPHIPLLAAQKSPTCQSIHKSKRSHIHTDEYYYCTVLLLLSYYYCTVEIVGLYRFQGLQNCERHASSRGTRRPNAFARRTSGFLCMCCIVTVQSCCRIVPRCRQHVDISTSPCMVSLLERSDWWGVNTTVSSIMNHEYTTSLTRPLDPRGRQQGHATRGDVHEPQPRNLKPPPKEKQEITTIIIFR